MKKIRHLFPLMLCFLSSSFVFSMVNAQQNPTDYNIYFKTGSVEPANNAYEFLTSFSVDVEAIYHNQFFKIIQFSELPDEEVKTALANAGVTLLDYLPYHAYFATFARDFNAEEMLDKGIRSIVDIETDYKLAPVLYEENYPDYAILEDGTISLLVSYYPNLDADQTVSALRSEGYPVLMRDDFGSYVNIAA